ncbi:MAG: 1-(5-phosphoribosyl)-5-[(5-phosphoribosylamino)methylideneamino]imidazole-4-carboxamide isomerase [Candidatus Brocadiia bacterium]
MIVLPAVDIQEGRCVRLLQGDPGTGKTYYEAPSRAARHWEDAGAEALHLVDLDGAINESGGNRDVVKRVLSELHIPVEVGGGLRSVESVERVLEAGAARAVIGTKAALDPEWAVELCQKLPDRIVIALDAREGLITVKGWQENSGIPARDLASRLADGAPAAFLYTDVSRDGMLTHPHFNGVEEIIKTTPVPVIASGGVSSVDDIRRLGECGADAVITGKALYEGELKLEDALETAKGFPGRLSASPGQN